MISPGSDLRATHCTRRVRRPLGAPSRAPTPCRRHFEMPAFWDSNSNFRKVKNKLFLSLLSIQPARATQSIMYVPVRVNGSYYYFTYRSVQIFKILFQVFYSQNLILHTRLCGNGFITQPSLLSDLIVTNMLINKRFVLAVYQYQHAFRRGRP